MGYRGICHVNRFHSLSVKQREGRQVSIGIWIGLYLFIKFLMTWGDIENGV